MFLLVSLLSVNWNLFLGTPFSGFKGCIKEPRLNNQPLPFSGSNDIVLSVDARKVEPECKDSGRCSDDNCPRFSVCMNTLSNFKCHCLPGHFGKWKKFFGLIDYHVLFIFNISFCSLEKVILLHTKEIALLSLSNIVYFWWMVISQTCDVFSNSMISEPFINYVIVKVNSTFLCYF